MENEQVDNSFTPEEALAASKAREAAAQAPAPSEVVEEAQPESVEASEVVVEGGSEVVAEEVVAEEAPVEEVKAEEVAE